MRLQNRETIEDFKNAQDNRIYIRKKYQIMKILYLIEEINQHLQKQ
jgi:hypothetical protein